MSKRIDYNKLIEENKKHPLCQGIEIPIQGGQGGTDYGCNYGSDVTCDNCRFLAGNRGRGKDPRAIINNP